MGKYRGPSDVPRGISWHKQYAYLAANAPDVGCPARAPAFERCAPEELQGPHAPAVVTERVPLAIWCLMPAVDANGDPTSDESCFGSTIPERSLKRRSIPRGARFMPSMIMPRADSGSERRCFPIFFVPNMLSVLDAVKASGLTVKEISLNNMGLEELDVSTYNGPDIYFSLRFSAAEDLSVLQGLMQKPNFSSLQYVDFRTENRAYYK